MPPSHPIRVLLVDDSPIAITLLMRMLAAAPDIAVVGHAPNGRRALELIPTLDPEVICTDLHMPEMDGLALTKKIMATCPRPILVVSISVKEGSLNAFRVLEAGAIDVFPKPGGDQPEIYQTMAPELIRKIRILSGVHVFRRIAREAAVVAAPPISAHPGAPIADAGRVVIIGASTGGPQAIQTILSQLPADFPCPVVCIQHISEGFLDGLMEWLAASCRLQVRLLRSGERPAAGTVYFPPEGRHLVFDAAGCFISSADPVSADHRPSITLAMTSAARCFGGKTIAVLLTGMGDDGAEGMQAVARAGGITIAQDEESCVVFGMPKRAIELQAAGYVLPVSGIPRLLLNPRPADRQEGGTGM